MPPLSDDAVACVRAAVATAEAAAAVGQQPQQQQQPHGAAPYDRLRLVRRCLAHAQAVGAEDRFAAAFVARTGGVAGDAVAAVDAFADRLVFGLFLPLRAIGSCSPAAASLPGNSAELADQPPAYIFAPSPMTRADEDGDLNESGQLAADLLSALDPAALALLSCAEAPSAANQVALPAAERRAIARFDAWLRPVAANGQTAGHCLVRAVDGGGELPSTATNAIIPDEAASARLLALHAAVAEALQTSGAGRFVDRILADTAVEDLASDGQTYLEQLLQLRLDGWWDGGRRAARGRDDDDDDDEGAVWVEQSMFVEEGVPSP